MWLPMPTPTYQMALKDEIFLNDQHHEVIDEDEDIAVRRLKAPEDVARP